MNTQETYESVIEPQNKRLINGQELWEYRELFYFFTWRDIKVKYKQTFLGILWALLQPLFMVIIFTFFFGRTLKVPSEGVDYPVFAFSGLLMWNIFSAGVSNAGNAMVANAHIIKKIYFPRLIIPLSAVISATFDFVMAFPIFVVMLFWFKVDIDVLKLLYCWPIAVLLAFIGTSGIGCLLSALNVKYRDFRYVIPFMIQALLFLTPIIYPVGILEHRWIKYILALNPMYGSIAFFRLPITGNIINIDLLLISMVSGLVMLVVGVLYFKRTEMYFADLT